ncbi:polymorphic toxin type 33 domain-containing protein [Neisseria yangbaofengii]|uniref:polymorphic toxin type 33 domain-containing protein n=1 Tax=Neisseria yangbaofengii TaxID=2709396 RepID=UPI0013EA5106|nr:polymorphic toxin type 33 domain-containing protein [Neisseria yangbaofengii]
MGTATGAAIGNSTANAAQGSLNAQGAVENNYGVSAISKGRRVIRIIQRGGRLTPKDALPVAEAGLVVAAACAITGNCDASQVLKDIWSGKFEDDFSLSENQTDKPNSGSYKANDIPQSTAGAPMPPDDDDDKQNIQKINDGYLKRKGLDAHRIKEEFMGRGNNSRYDLYVDKNTGEVIIFRKGGLGNGTRTGYFIK